MPENLQIDQPSRNYGDRFYFGSVLLQILKRYIPPTPVKRMLWGETLKMELSRSKGIHVYIPVSVLLELYEAFSTVETSIGFSEMTVMDSISFNLISSAFFR